MCAIVKGVALDTGRREGWGGRHKPLVLDQVALQMELSFHTPLRFFCMALVNFFFIYWMRKSFAFKLVKRKNDQIGKLPWQVVAWAGMDCPAQHFKNFVIDANPGLTIPSWGFAASTSVAFRLSILPAHEAPGHSHFRKCQKMGYEYVITGDGDPQISCERRARTNGYRRTIELMRLAMRHFCKYTTGQVMIFASQSLR